MVAIAWYWLAVIIAVCGLVGWMGAAMFGRLRLDVAESLIAEWRQAHVRKSRECEELDGRAQTMLGKLCKMEAENVELQWEIAALRGEPRPGESKAGGTTEEVASIIRDLQDEGIVTAGHVTKMEMTG